MLEVKYIDDADELVKACDALKIAQNTSGMNAVLLVDGNVGGLCRLRLVDDIVFDEFVLAEQYDTFENVDFFFRAILFKLSKTGLYIKINATDDRLNKFGFEGYGDTMRVYSENIKFPSQCHK